ncbi:MAG: hypothetical protein IPM82_02460 [Saprospiraceae bacterium]|nr:hypothetical protein [Saprospiraceae bacterium]
MAISTNELPSRANEQALRQTELASGKDERMPRKNERLVRKNEPVSGRNEGVVRKRRTFGKKGALLREIRILRMGAVKGPKNWPFCHQNSAKRCCW